MAILTKTQLLVAASANQTLTFDLGQNYNYNTVLFSADFTGTGITGTIQLDFANDNTATTQWYQGRPNIYGGGSISGFNPTIGNAASTAPTFPINLDVLSLDATPPDKLPYRYVRATLALSAAPVAGTFMVCSTQSLGTLGR